MAIFDDFKKKDNKDEDKGEGDFTQSGFGDHTKVVTGAGLTHVAGRLLALLQITSGLDQGKIVEVPVSGRFVVGRGKDCNLVLNDRSCSRHHVELWHDFDNNYKIRDLGSTNGTRLNDRKIDAPTALSSGDRIQVGDTAILRFTIVTEEEAKTQIDMYHKATRDPLTNAWNRRQFEETLARELNLQRRGGQGLTLILMDIDFFKKINDSFGHAAGDEVLKDFCRRVEACVRAEDIVARIGGEEFAVLGRADSAEGASILAERIRTRVEFTPANFEGRSISYTVSLGVAYLEPKAFLNGDELYQKADECLYEAKNGGRNRHVLRVFKATT